MQDGLTKSISPRKMDVCAKEGAHLEGKIMFMLLAGGLLIIIIAVVIAVVAAVASSHDSGKGDPMD